MEGLYQLCEEGCPSLPCGGSTWKGAALNGFGLKGQDRSSCCVEVSLGMGLEARGVRAEAGTRVKPELQKPTSEHKSLC